MLPFEGIKVLDFSQAMFGPVCTRLLGDLGADVIKIEPLEGDFTRLTPGGGDSTAFLSCNRSKRSLSINLKDTRGLEIVLRLVTNVDVLVQNFRPGVMKELGLDYEALHKINPRLIYGSFYMYGETGPLAHRRGADIWAQAMTGVVASQGSPDGPPYLAAHFFLDYGGAALNAFAIATALLMRERTGVGQEVTNNLINSGAYLQEYAISYYLMEGRLFKKGGRGAASGIFPYGAYPAKDGDVVTLFGQDDQEWSTVCSILGIEQLLTDPRYDSHEKRVQRKFELYPILDEAFRKKNRTEWQELFRQHGLRCDPCLDYAEFLAHPQFEANAMIEEISHPQYGKLRMLGVPIKFKGTGAIKQKRHPPILGEHTREILGELGYTDEQIEKFRNDGVIGVPSSDAFEARIRGFTTTAPPTRKGARRTNS
jgi:crotonobetainyl-CoA:carnitine CoA-transferase CaiB-like acyl-CoA transferase